MLSLDANLGDGMSLYDLVATHVDLLAHTAAGCSKTNGSAPYCTGSPRRSAVVFADTEGEGTTWTEAAAAGAPDPGAFGERVRRKAKRLATEQRRRAGQCRMGPRNPR
ncbi:hypothetical protein [Streptomyces sp. NPDC005141]